MTDPLNPNHDEPAEGPRDSAYSTPSGADTSGAGDAGANVGARASDVLDQIKVAVDDIAEKAAPTVRELSAKAAEIVAIAADKAAPLAHKAGEVTADASSKLAEKSRVFAADVREQMTGAKDDATDAAREAAEDNPPL